MGSAWYGVLAGTPASRTAAAGLSARAGFAVLAGFVPFAGLPALVVLAAFAGLPAPVGGTCLLDLLGVTDMRPMIRHWRPIRPVLFITGAANPRRPASAPIRLPLPAD